MPWLTGGVCQIKPVLIEEVVDIELSLQIPGNKPPYIGYGLTHHETQAGSGTLKVLLIGVDDGE